MRYLVRALFNGRVHYIHTDNINTARYLFDVIKADIQNGTVTIWHGDTDLMQCDKAAGKIVLEWEKQPN